MVRVIWTAICERRAAVIDEPLYAYAVTREA